MNKTIDKKNTLVKIKKVYCNGDNEHPIVYIKFTNSTSLCPYCGKKFFLEKNDKKQSN